MTRPFLLTDCRAGLEPAPTNMEEEAGVKGKCKDKPLNNVLSIRVSDEEMATMNKISRYTQKNVSVLMREAIHGYGPYRDLATKQVEKVMEERILPFVLLSRQGSQ